MAGLGASSVGFVFRFFKHLPEHIRHCLRHDHPLFYHVRVFGEAIFFLACVSPQRFALDFIEPVAAGGFLGQKFADAVQRARHPSQLQENIPRRVRGESKAVDSSR